MEIFSQRLRELRKEKNLTQKELAEALDMTQRKISYYEMGGSDPSTSTLLKIAKYFDVSVDYLLGNAPV